MAKSASELWDLLHESASCINKESELYARVQDALDAGAESNERVNRAQWIIDEAIRHVHELECGLVADGTIQGNGVCFEALRVMDRESA
jgi:hypothetical protein